MTYYEILEVSESASPETIKAAYRSLVKKYHPDVFEGDVSEANFKMTELNKAYDILSDTEKRRAYDATLRNSRNDTSESVTSERSEYIKKDLKQESGHEKFGNSGCGSGCSGCFGKLFGLAFWIFVIYFTLRSCGWIKDGEVGHKETDESTYVISESADEVPYNDVQGPKTQLTPEEINAEKIYFHTPYTDMSTVEIHDFKERKKVLEFMVSIGTDKSILDNGCFVSYENKLFGDDYYYSTVAETKYYYVGKLKNNKPHGFGAIVGFSDGSGTYEFAGEVLFYYVGNFYEGMKNGFGVEFMADEIDVYHAISLIIELDVVADENGEALCRYLFNNVKYEGYWKKNKYNGKGNEFYFSEYHFYEEINAPIPGYIYGNAYPDVTKGEWKNGELSGKVSVYKFNHKDYIGEMKNGHKNGKGTMFYSDNQVQYEGEWKNGVPHGRGVYYDYDGEVIYSGIWEKGDYSRK